MLTMAHGCADLTVSAEGLAALPAGEARSIAGSATIRESSKEGWYRPKVGPGTRIGKVPDRHAREGV